MKWLVVLGSVFLAVRLLAEGMTTVKAQRQEPEFLTPPGIETARPTPQKGAPWPPVLPPRFIPPRER